jgi:1-deoxy-D-xylulose-5-phosphate reductoisomerase
MGHLRVGGHPLRPLVVLGATGSIGRQTLDVAERIGAPVAVIAAGRASSELLELALEHPDATVCVVEGGDQLRRLELQLGARLRVGQAAVTDAASMSGSIVVNGIVGAAGLGPSLAALHAGNRLALANKESLVIGGPLIRAARESGGGEVVPIDSEHSAVWQCLVGEPAGVVRRLVLTASGGPFHGRSPASLDDVTVEEALAHPTWDMGKRISVDSATLMNKAFEVIEAHYLFGIPYDSIDVVVHPQSVVHSFVEFTDGVVKAEVGFPDMRKPIQYAITGPTRVPVSAEPFSLVGTTLTFEAPDRDSFPCLDLGYAAGRAGGTAPVVLNAADEVAVAAFLSGEIAFPAIAAVVEAVLERHDVFVPGTVAEIEAVDGDARTWAREAVRSLQR